ncbi:Major surface-labeled trophozoite antigen precursor [Giardia duodenalis]|uniref:Major surface-labeled trophozoite antigen n=1 Tax=Giardia intestinalis TaxID=5741 RepID=V6TPV3_GIAIN|nr:Major surface-labeled trophozoite antigen precursor [Giardia intestinalis]
MHCQEQSLIETDSICATKFRLMDRLTEKMNPHALPIPAPRYYTQQQFGLLSGYRRTMHACPSHKRVGGRCYQRVLDRATEYCI